MKIKETDKCIIGIAIVITIVFTALALIVLKITYNHVDDDVETNLMNIARIVATDNEVIAKLSSEDMTLNDYINTYYDDIKDISFIVVMDQSSVRYSHPDPEKVGLTFVGGDELDAINGETYTSSSTGTLGNSVRVFVPIKNGTTQIGVVSVGYLTTAIKEMKLDQTLLTIFSFGVSLILANLSMLFLSKRFRRNLFGFQPTEIAMLYSENKTIIDQLEEAVISVDKDLNITTINNKSKKMFGLSKNDISKKVYDVFKDFDYTDIINDELHIKNEHITIKDEKLLVTSFPLYLNDKVVGATAIFRNRLEIDALLDQISGYQQIAKALRKQKHEFQNKLHVVLGLIKMKDYEKAENYITQNVYTTNLASDYYSSRISDDRILALFIGKEIQSKEHNVKLMLTADSYLTKKHNPINDDDIVIVLGNLIDNAFEAYDNKDMEDKKVVVDIFEDDDKVKITVIDQAGGIDEKIRGKMFKRGVSSKKGESRGTGLSLVNEIVHVYNGEKNVESTVEATKIEIKLMKVIG